MCTLALAFGAHAGAAFAQPARSFTDSIAGTVVTVEMLPVPAGTIQLPGAAPVEVGPFWIMKTEVTWNLFDVFVFELDRPARDAGTSDALARPSKPYVLPGDAYGHRGYPALGMSFLSAKSFAQWLSAKTGRKYRLPTEAEWVHACRLNHPQLSTSNSQLPTVSWFSSNADDKTHPVASLAPGVLGAHDMLGNAAEWVVAGSDSVVMGGGFTSESADVSCTARRRQTPAWNESDPQLPKSRWWLTDAFFVGLRLIVDS